MFRRLATLGVIVVACLAFATSAETASAGASTRPVNLSMTFAYKSVLTVTTTDSTTTTTSAYRSTLTITHDGGGQVTPDGQGPAGTHLYCNKAYAFTDPNGVFTIQHACGGKTAPWGYIINPAECATAIGPAYESGMMWELNGKQQGTQAPHSEPCDYTFHGTFNPVVDNSTVVYSDVITWPIKGGHAQLQFYGSFLATGTAGGPCGVVTRAQAVPAC